MNTLRLSRGGGKRRRHASSSATRAAATASAAGTVPQLLRLWSRWRESLLGADATTRYALHRRVRESFAAINRWKPQALC